MRDRGRVPNGKVNGREDFFSFGSNFAVAGECFGKWYRVDLNLYIYTQQDLVIF